MINIGYQGMEGSNSLLAAQKLANELNLENVNFIPLLTSIGVKKALDEKEIEYGVFATFNTIGGKVIETAEVLENAEFEVVKETTLSIRHCVFVKTDDTVVTDIASHIQALKQCKGTLKVLFPFANLKAIEDTAIGAKYLANGYLSETTGVVCTKAAGQLYNLHLLYEDVQDSRENATKFIIIKIN